MRKLIKNSKLQFQEDDQLIAIALKELEYQEKNQKINMTTKSRAIKKNRKFQISGHKRIARIDLHILKNVIRKIRKREYLHKRQF